MKPAEARRWRQRPSDPRAVWTLEQAGVHPLLARLYAARGVRSAPDCDTELAGLLPPALLAGCEQAATLLADAVEQRKHICVVADYDCDGATACAVALRGLRRMGASASYWVPNRFTDGYGLTPGIVDAVAALEPPVQLIVTVDNGIASIEGIERARERGIATLITDHHLPGAVLPAADAIVNPNQPGCPFPSKALAGCGVMFYVLIALRGELRRRGLPAGTVRLDDLLDLVALGTVADLVPLDANNRRLVAQGLARMRAGRMQPGVRALFDAARRRWQEASCFDLGYALGPRVNAAGRLEDMRTGIACLLSDAPDEAAALAARLDGINAERRAIETDVREQALQALASLGDGASFAARRSIAVYRPDWHEGVIGIVAGRLKDRFNRPSFVFTDAQDGSLKGSGRSIAGLHLRDALDAISKREPGLLLRFGGHAMAAGASLAAGGFERFAAAFDAVAAAGIEPAALEGELWHDGALDALWWQPEVARMLREQVWGQSFAAPLFEAEVDVLGQRLLGQRHSAFRVLLDGQVREALRWGDTEPLPGARCRIAYRLELDDWQGEQRLRMVIEAARA
jgi:single-stranded-DNA-specific exonuclease